MPLLVIILVFLANKATLVAGQLLTRLVAALLTYSKHAGTA